MNRKVIGMYLKHLREQKKLTQEQLASVFSEDYGIIISVHAISEWENGNTLPSGDNLEVLAKIYDKTLDELLDGKDEENVNYDNIYFRSIIDPVANRRLDSHFFIKRSKKIRIIKKFKEFIKKTINKAISNEENREFKYLFENFYDFTAYGKSLLKENQDVSFTSFLYLIKRIASEFVDKSFEEQYWEIQKIFTQEDELINQYRFDISDINNVDKPEVKELFIESESWVKDAMLAYFQEKEPLTSTPDSFGSEKLQRFIDKNGNYNRDVFYKNCMRMLIENGACINKTFFNKVEIIEQKMSIINTLEGLHRMYFEPLLLRTLNDDGTYVYHRVENNEFNRFLLNVDNFYSDVIAELVKAGLTIEDIYYKVLLPEEISDDIYLLIAKSKNINTDRDKSLWMADLKIRTFSLISARNLFKKQVERDISNKKLYKDLLAMLKKGEKYYIDREVKRSSRTIRMETMIERKNKMTYSQFLEARDEKLTKKMLIDLDKLSFDEIRSKYFLKED